MAFTGLVCPDSDSAHLRNSRDALGLSWFVAPVWRVKPQPVSGVAVGTPLGPCGEQDMAHGDILELASLPAGHGAGGVVPARTSQDTLRGADLPTLEFPDAAGEWNAHLTSKIASNPFPCRFLQWDDCMAWGWGEVSSCLANLGAAVLQSLLTPQVESASLQVFKKRVDTAFGDRVQWDTWQTLVSGTT